MSPKISEENICKRIGSWEKQSKEIEKVEIQKIKWLIKKSKTWDVNGKLGKPSPPQNLYCSDWKWKFAPSPRYGNGCFNISFSSLFFVGFPNFLYVFFFFFTICCIGGESFFATKHTSGEKTLAYLLYPLL